MLVTGASTKASKIRVLDKVPYLCYSVQFRKDKGKYVLAFLDSESELNAVTPASTAHLGLKLRMTNVGAQKIDRSSLATYDMIIAAFQVVDKLGSFCFFQETFLLADISMEVVLGISFLTFGNANIQFTKKQLTWRTYTTKKALPTTRQVEIIDQKEFAKTALDENVKALWCMLAPWD